MTNPLIEKWEELNRSKEEHPPKNTKAGYELDPDFVEKLKDVNTLSTVQVGSGITASNYVSATNSSISYKPIKSYDNDTITGYFSQVADKVKNGTARVSSATMEIGNVCGFYDGVKKVTFDVYLYD